MTDIYRLMPVIFYDITKNLVKDASFFYLPNNQVVRKAILCNISLFIK